MAALIEKETGVKPELKYGARGEFSVLVDGEVVAKKGFWGLPSEKKVLSAVKGELNVA